MAQPKLHSFEASSGNKTYATRDNAAKAVTKCFEKSQNEAHGQLTYFITEIDHGPYKGRFIPVFVGERALHAGVHFQFHVIA